ncbi:class I adenylate-forming enzyme family protein [Lentzea jiangxiensis]|uniref:Acyl-CoA synthetase (AMP-forming)/AMP-acid ligase II n=1 Tax=Lentzea jiangxiensis TaxID=641025 RepID=A0A1H0W9Y9_9PSEU|nr:fatty acid--CoA ligase family protein [Lentzea jiangxiensis]SDP87590.1 Acyl-CoA synthetase (AMP-forming)/AMP-acid ligase II [Lentzea jiangxiensis]
MPARDAEPFPRAVLDVLTAAADRPVFEHGTRVVTGAEMLDLVARIASGLRGNGIGPGDGLALLLGVDAGAFATILAGHVVGARVVGVRPGLTDAQVRHLLGLDIAAVVTDAGGAARAVAAGTPVRLTVTDLLAHSPEPLRCRGKLGDVARLIHTSGSTGAPKACAQTYAAMTGAWTARPESWPPAIRDLATRLDRYLVFGSLSSQVMFEYAILTLTAGGTIVVADHPADAITELRATARVITAPGLAKLVAAQKREPADLSTLKALLVSGSPLTPDRHREALDVLGPVLFHGYGQTETGMISMATPDDPPGTVGKPPVDVEVRDGELYVRTPGQASGYWADAGESAEVFVDGWVRTRDLGRIDDDGYLRLTGRARDVVIVNANLHHVGPIEQVLAEHPDVAEVYVVAVPDDETGEAVHAFVVPKADRVPELGELRELVTARLGAACAPSRLTAISEPPVAPSGKPDKRQLAESATTA